MEILTKGLYCILHSIHHNLSGEMKIKNHASSSSAQVFIPSFVDSVTSQLNTDLGQDQVNVSDDLTSTEALTQTERSRYEKFVDIDVEDTKESSSDSEDFSESSFEELQERTAMNDSILGDPETDQLLVPPCPGSVTGSSDPGDDDSDSSIDSDDEDKLIHGQDSEESATEVNISSTDQDMMMFVGHSDGSKPLLHDNDDEETEMEPHQTTVTNGALEKSVPLDDQSRRRSDTKSSGEVDLDAEVERNLLSQIVRDLHPHEKDLFGSQPFNNKGTTEVVLGIPPSQPTATQSNEQQTKAPRKESDLFGQAPFSVKDSFESTASISSHKPIRIQVTSNPVSFLKPLSASVVVPTDKLVSLASNLSLKNTPTTVSLLSSTVTPSSQKLDATVPTTKESCPKTTTVLTSPPSSSSNSVTIPESVSNVKDSKKKVKEKESKLKIHVPTKLTKPKAIKLEDDDDDADGLIADDDNDLLEVSKKSQQKESKKFSLVNKSSKDKFKEKKDKIKDKMKEKPKKKDKEDKEKSKEEKRARKEEKEKVKADKIKRDKSKDKKSSSNKNSEVALLSPTTSTPSGVKTTKPDIGSVGGFANMSFEDAVEETMPIKN
jgi:hypothetical protein